MDNTAWHTFLFLHVPRTGGSNLWHSISAAASEQGGLHCFDVYATSLTDFASSDCAATVLRNMVPSIAGCDGHRLVHHHDSWGGFRSLHSLYPRSFTVLRDPVARYVSSVQFMHQHLTGELGARARGLELDFLASKAEAISGVVGVCSGRVADAIARLYRRTPPLLWRILRTPELQDYYVRFFFNYLAGERVGRAEMEAFPRPVETVLNSPGVEVLSAALLQHFEHIGRTESLGLTFDYFESCSGLRIERRDVLRNARQSQSPRLLSLLLRPFFRWDYVLLDYLFPEHTK